MQFQVMEEFGGSHDAMARKIKERLVAMARKRRAQAAAHRPVLAVTEVSIQPKHIVFQTPHGLAYTVERDLPLGIRTGNGSPMTKITLPYIAGYTE